MLNSIKYDLWVKEIENEITLAAMSSITVFHGAQLSCLNMHANSISDFPAWKRSVFNVSSLHSRPDRMSEQCPS